MRPKDIDFQPSPRLSSAPFSRRWLSDAEISLRMAEFPFFRTGTRSRPPVTWLKPCRFPIPASPTRNHDIPASARFLYRSFALLPFTRHASQIRPYPPSDRSSFLSRSPSRSCGQFGIGSSFDRCCGIRHRFVKHSRNVESIIPPLPQKTSILKLKESIKL